MGVLKAFLLLEAASPEEQARGAICLSGRVETTMAFESSDAPLVPIERSVWSDRGVGRSLFFLAGFAGCPKLLRP